MSFEDRDDLPITEEEVSRSVNDKVTEYNGVGSDPSKPSNNSKRDPPVMI
jgi:hypothetical protein